MAGFKFDMEKLEKLNDPDRLKDIPPEFIRDKLAVDHPGTVVDVGAGTGFFSIRFARMQRVDKVYALDIADVMVEYMKNNVSPVYKAVEPLKMDESDIPLPDNTAGVVAMINLHHELHEPVKVLNECARVLKPGGKLAVIDWKKKETEHGPPVSKRYDTELISQQFRETPFQSVSIYEELPNHFLMVGENGKTIQS